MIAQLTGINLNATKTTNAGKTLTGIEFSYQPPPYQGQSKPPVTRFIFSNSPIAPALQNVSVGDWVEITFDNTQYKNPATLSPAQAPSSGGQQQAHQSQQSQRQYAPSNNDKDGQIARAVALKAATDVVVTLIPLGEFPKKSLKDPEFFATKISETARSMEPYLLNTDTEEATSTVEGSPELKQEGFQD